jgi:hypothetical protein
MRRASLRRKKRVPRSSTSDSDLSSIRHSSFQPRGLARVPRSSTGSNVAEGGTPFVFGSLSDCILCAPRSGTGNPFRGLGAQGTPQPHDQLLSSIHPQRTRDRYSVRSVQSVVQQIGILTTECTECTESGDRYSVRSAPFVFGGLSGRIVASSCRGRRNAFRPGALSGAKRGLGAEAPCWLDRAFAENCQHEAEAPRPRFAPSRLRVRPPAERRDRGGTEGPVAASARPPTTSSTAASEPTHQVNDQGDQDDEANAATAKGRTAIVEATAAKKKDQHENK